MELKLELCKLLPEQLEGYKNRASTQFEIWKKNRQVLDTEWLHVCHLIEATFTTLECYQYQDRLCEIAVDWNPKQKALTWLWHTPWQQRAQAILKVKPSPQPAPPATDEKEGE